MPDYEDDPSPREQLIEAVQHYLDEHPATMIFDEAFTADPFALSAADLSTETLQDIYDNYIRPQEIVP